MTALHFRLLLVLLAGLALAGGVAARQWLAASPPAMAPAVPEPALADLDGKPHRLAEWRGKVVVLNFWASWCGPCREEMPEFSRMQQRLGERGLQFVGVAIDDAEAVRDFLRQHPVSYPILIGDEHTPEWTERLGNRSAGLPFTAILDRDGRTVATRTGVLDPAELLRIVQPLLDQAATTAAR